jgi:hypothetical protein
MVAVLESPIELPAEFCPDCERETTFVIEFAFANSLLRTCKGCGAVRVAVSLPKELR